MNYADGYREGVRDGERWANQTYVWLGTAIGVVLSGAIVLVVLFVQPGFLR